MNAFTFLLILNIIINTVYIIALSINIKYINKLSKQINNENVFYNPYLSDDKRTDFEENVFNSHIIYKDNCKEEAEEDTHTQEYEVFDNVTEFIEYVSGYNLNILNIETNEVHTIKYLEKLDLPDVEDDLLITFDDGSREIFKPYMYAAYF